MDSIFRLTSDEYSKIIGISTEALRSRRRRGQEEGNFKKFGKVFWWKSPSRDRPAIVDNRSNDRVPSSLSPVASGLKPVTRKRRRGVVLNGEQTNYHNARNGFQLEELNRVRALGKIRDELGDEVVDEISPELFELAKKNVQKKKEEKFKKEIAKAETPPNGVYVGYDRTPSIYGSKLNAVGLKNKEDEYHRKQSKKWENETKVIFRTEPGKRHLPSFESSTRPYQFRNPYEIGQGSVDDGSVSFEEWELPKDDREPRFANKIEEAIWRAKNKAPY